MASSDWYAPLRDLASLGSQTARPGSLAGLHETKKLHKGQFFTSHALARFVWSLVEPAMARALAEHPGERVAILDNAVGSGRLLQFARPAQHVIAGVDVDEASVRALGEAADAAGFECEFLHAGMEEIQPQGFGVGLINPPYSLSLQSPLLQPYPCTTWGRFGPNSGALSHAYALHQVLEACDMVVAIVGRGYAEEVSADSTLRPRLRAIFHAPAGSFRDDGTEVAISILVFGLPGDQRVLDQRLSRLDDDVPALDLVCRTTCSRQPRLRLRHLDDQGPTITLPVTGDTRVCLTHDGRRIGLHYGCGLTQAKVANAVLRESVATYAGAEGKPHRYPKEARYTGQGALDVEVHLLQPDPLASFKGLLETIRLAGGQPDVDPGLWGYLRRRIRQHARQIAPNRHVVRVPTGHPHAGNAVWGRARRQHLADPTIWGSPLIDEGARVHFVPDADGSDYTYAIADQTYTISPEDMYLRFEVEQAPESAEWRVVHEGRAAAFPALAYALRARARALGVDALFGDWQFQLEDLIESFINPRGGIVAWDPGLGKARLAVALILMSQCKHGLIVVEPYLVDEMLIELRGLPIDPSLWQVITTPGDLDNLRRVNVITYSRLRTPVISSRARITYARRLRRRIGVLVADEGELLSNANTQQSRALWQVSAKRRYILTGTPLANYSHNILPQLAFTGGDGTAAQCFGIRRGYLEPRLRTSIAYMERGVDRFRDRHVAFEWVTREFEDELQKGAKREVPKIVRLDEYRAALAPHVKRRVTDEPEVARHVAIPTPERSVIEIEWDERHLAYYLAVAEDFAEVYRQMYRDAERAGRNVNLVAVLARINAVRMACNYPQRDIRGFGRFTGVTTKQRYAADRLAELAANGHKSILYADNPGCLAVIAAALEARETPCVLFHGGLPIKQRTREMNKRFRFGDCPVLLSTLSVGQKGLNIPQADRVLFYNRAWNAKTEEQAGRRVLRPQQPGPVAFEYLHLRGSIDGYQAQMVRWKAETSHTGLDYGAPTLDDEPFLHMDALLGQFCSDLAQLRGCERHELRTQLAATEEVA